ncbi:MAG: helix-turn-helix domain-containing protein [Burkholderiales bacterium]|nr:helix-turn-helix domain-containing protein [Burkholderiales bacterium]
MSNPVLSGATRALIKRVLALIGTARDDPRYPEMGQSVLGLCEAALKAIQAAHVEEVAADPVVTTRPGNLDLRIAELAAHGKGVREIARQLRVNASTVSRRLRNAKQASATPSATSDATPSV